MICAIEQRPMDYWIDLFTGTTWDEFRKAGAKVTGFRERTRASARRVHAGDIFLCYLTGVMHWVGALRVLGPSKDTSRIWKEDAFPVRFDVEPLVLLEPSHGVPMQELQGNVAFFTGPKDSGKFKGFVRISLNKFKRPEDGELVLKLLRQAERAPVTRPVDPKKLARKYLYKAERNSGKRTVSAIVSVPERDERPPQAVALEANREADVVSATRHTEMQYYLLYLGAEMGLDVWVARNDRSKVWNGDTLGSMRRMLAQLPTQFNEATNRTIELIDVLWLKGHSIVAAFEVESTTSIYSGLLRMSDLLALQPNLDINLYLVAPDERRAKVEQEILRPTFTLRDRPLPEVCGFLSFSRLVETAEGIQRLGLAASLKPDFLIKKAEFFGPEGES
jgi:hypothetical protein